MAKKTSYYVGGMASCYAAGAASTYVGSIIGNMIWPYGVGKFVGAMVGLGISAFFVFPIVALWKHMYGYNK